MTKNRFNKSLRIKSKSDIDLLFKKGRFLKQGALTLKWVLIEKDSIAPSVQVLISVPKRKFKLAVDRNLLKRKIKEAYRLNRHQIELDIPNKKLLIAIIYNNHEIREFNALMDDIILSLRKLNSQLIREQKKSST